MMTNEELTEDLVRPGRHATMRAFNVEEYDDLWRACEALQRQS
ncbi:MAG: hypothetical protein ACXVH6_06035 [Halobacteriota archaeon]